MCGFAISLELAQLIEGVFLRSLDALFVEAQVDEVLRPVAKDFGGSQG
jgi:hypothetical protein